MLDARWPPRNWARAALKAIADGGPAAVAVGPPARTLGVTKGSFYAHHRNRDELITAALAEWTRSHGEGGLAEFIAITDPARRLREPADRAASRARVAYAAILGLSHLAQTDPDAPLPPYSPTRRPRSSSHRDRARRATG